MPNKIIKLSIIFFLLSGILKTQEIQFPDGQKVKSASSNSLFLMLDKQLWKIDTRLLFSGLFKDYQNPAIVSDSIINTLHFGQQINEAYLIRGYSNEIYLYINKVKRHIDSPEVMDAFGFNWNYVSRITPNELESIPTGNKITIDGSQVYPLPCGVSDDK